MSRILLITPRLPWPAEPSGTAQRTNLLRRCLQARGEVEIMLLWPPDYSVVRNADAAELRERFGVVAHFPWPGQRQAGIWERPAQWLGGPPGRLSQLLARQVGDFASDARASQWLRERLAEQHYDLIVSRYLRPATLAGLTNGQATGAGIPKILDIDDLPWLYLWWRTSVHPWGGWKGKLGAMAVQLHLRRLCRRAMGRFDHVWTTSEEDRRAVRMGHTSILPNIPFASPESPHFEPLPPNPQSQEVLFVGALHYPPNSEGLDHFLRHVWPQVRASQPKAGLRVVGVGLPEDQQRRWSLIAGVEIIGFVENLRVAYERAAFTVAPVYWGGGTKIKVIESLAHGRTCVTTPHALHGYQAALKHGEAIWCGKTDEELAQGCIKLLRDVDLRARLATRGGQICQSRFSFDNFNEAVRRTLEQITER